MCVVDSQVHPHDDGSAPSLVTFSGMLIRFAEWGGSEEEEEVFLSKAHFHIIYISATLVTFTYRGRESLFFVCFC